MKCGCGVHEITDQERADLPRKDGITFCFQSCITGYTARNREKQSRLGFDFDVVTGPIEDIDISELAGA